MFIRLRKAVMKIPSEITLTNDAVTLVPMTIDYVQEFYDAGQDDAVWRWAPPHQCQSIETARQWVEQGLSEVAKGHQVMFGIIDNASGRFVGSTRYCSIDIVNSGIEIGFTFIHPEFQRSHINSNAKLLLLTHAFEELGAIRVQLRTHEQNQKSRNAISRLGTTFEGILRNHRLLSTGEYRNTALFSLLSDEWLQAKTQLINRIIDGASEVAVKKLTIDDGVIDLMREFPLAQIIISNCDALSDQIIYLPLRFDAIHGTLTGHLSVSNKLLPLLTHEAKVTVIFQGDDAYISPLQHEKIRVPTWIYRRVHISGSCKLLLPEYNKQELDLQVQEYENGQWLIDEQPAVMINNMLQNIRCFEITIKKLDKHFKMEDNKPIKVRESIAERLMANGQLSLAAAHLGSDKLFIK